LFLGLLDSTLFPGLSSSILVNQGFAIEQAKTAQRILAVVLTLLSEHNASSVVVTGHSLGAALALPSRCPRAALALPSRCSTQSTSRCMCQRARA
jgi:hypothetical protein